VAGQGAGIALTVFGFVMLFVGVLLGSMCLLSGGLLCSGTLIGELGGGFFLFGLVMLVLGIGTLVAQGRRSPPPAAQVPFAPRALPATPPASPTARVASECPKCGGPVDARVRACEWCGTPLL
jgi:hypothetical protein